MKLLGHVLTGPRPAIGIVGIVLVHCEMLGAPGSGKSATTGGLADEALGTEDDAIGCYLPEPMRRRLAAITFPVVRAAGRPLTPRLESTKEVTASI